MQYVIGLGSLPHQNEMVGAYSDSPLSSINVLFGSERFHLFLPYNSELDLASAASCEAESLCDLLCTENHAKSRFSTAKPSMISIPTPIRAEKLARNVQVRPTTRGPQTAP